jgi:hypothetical protein
MSLDIHQNIFNIYTTMGYLTTITLHNDALHSFEKHPALFAEALFDGINRANRFNREVSVSFSEPNGASYGGYINVQASRHADDETIYLHTGNGVTNLNPWNKDFSELVENRPELAEEYVKKAERILKEAKAKIKAKKAKKVS